MGSGGEEWGWSEGKGKMLGEEWGLEEECVCMCVSAE